MRSEAIERKYAAASIAEGRLAEMGQWPVCG